VEIQSLEEFGMCECVRVVYICMGHREKDKIRSICLPPYN
jgi:hypothetical protein